MKIKTYSAKTVSEITLPKELGKEINLPLLAQAIRVYEDNTHPGNSKTKTRSEVKISKRKIYKQKHTGRARHGAKSAPIFVGGGTAHGPKGIKRKLTLPKKMKRKAKDTAFSIKANQKRLVGIIVDKVAKTADARLILDKVVKNESENIQPKTALIALSDKNSDKGKYFRNLRGIKVKPYKNLSAYDIYFGGLILIDKEVFDKPKEKKAINK